MSLVGTVLALPGRLEPDNAQARGWLREELASPAYRDTRDPLQRAFDAFRQWISDLLNGMNGPSHALPTVVAALIGAALVALVLLALRFVRRTARAQRVAVEAVLADDRLTAEQFRTRAVQAHAQGRYAACVLDSLRAIARDAVERTLLEDVPSLTAHEIATRLETVFPGQAQDVRWAADRFDAVAYGKGAASRGDADRMMALDRALSRARPVHRNADRALAAPAQPVAS